jgi:hypothetical protein
MEWQGYEAEIFWLKLEIETLTNKSPKFCNIICIGKREQRYTVVALILSSTNKGKVNLTNLIFLTKVHSDLQDTHIHTHTHTQTYTYTNINVHTHIHTHIHTHTHKHTHTTTTTTTFITTTESLHVPENHNFLYLSDGIKLKRNNFVSLTANTSHFETTGAFLSW